MHKKHTLANLLLAFTTFYITPCCKEFTYPEEQKSLRNLCLSTMYTHRISYHILEPSIKQMVPVGIYKQTLNYVLFDEIFQNPKNPNVAKVRELLDAGANPNFIYPLSTIKWVNGKDVWKKTEDMNKAGFCIMAIIARQSEFNKTMQEVTDLLIERGGDINEESGNDPYNPPYGWTTPIKHAQQSGNTGFISYAQAIHEKAHS